MAITNGYATLDQVKSALKIIDNIDDTLLELAVEAASREIDAYCGRVFYDMGSGSRFYAASDPYFCPIDDCQSVTQIATAVTSNGNYDTVWANPSTGQNNGDYQVEPLNAAYPTDGIIAPITGVRALWRYLFPTIGGNALVKVTGTWGWASTPTAVKQATVILASRIFKRNDSPMGVAGFGDMGVMRISRTDPDVAALVDTYRKVNGMV